VVEYCCFNGEAFPRFDFIQYDQHALSYVLVQVTMNVPLTQVKLLRTIQMETRTRTRTCVCVNAASVPDLRMGKLGEIRGCTRATTTREPLNISAKKTAIKAIVGAFNNKNNTSDWS